MKMDIISGFLGAGKTTLIQKLMNELYQNEKILIIENEFGEVGLDAAILRKNGYTLKELNAGCICCNISGDFATVLQSIINEVNVDRIVVEPSGVANLSDLLKVVNPLIAVERKIVVLDGIKYQVYSKNFKNFFLDQLMNANVVFFSKTKNQNLDLMLETVLSIQPKAAVFVDEWDTFKVQQLDVHLDQNIVTHHSDVRFFVKVIHLENPLTLQTFQDLIVDIQQHQFLRAKGNVLLEDGTWKHFEFASGILKIEDSALLTKSSFVLIDDKKIHYEK